MFCIVCVLHRKCSAVGDQHDAHAHAQESGDAPCSILSPIILSRPYQDSYMSKKATVLQPRMRCTPEARLFLLDTATQDVWMPSVELTLRRRWTTARFRCRHPTRGVKLWITVIAMPSYTLAPTAFLARPVLPLSRTPGPLSIEMLPPPR